MPISESPPNALALSGRPGTLRAFVPDPLPPELDAASFVRLTDALVRAERALGLLEGSARRLANPHILIGPFARKEAIRSSGIEDTFADIEEVVRVEADLDRHTRRNDAVEVRNYVRALEQGLRSDLPISQRLIRELHCTLLTETRGANRDPGNYRRSQNFIGGGGAVRFVPPPANRVPDLMSDLERFVHDTRIELPQLIRIALTHYQFETIHPFQDGNGRVGRLLITLQLCDGARLTKPLVYVSGHFEKHRAEYYDRLLAVSMVGDWVGWILFFLEAIESTCRDALRRSDDLLQLQQEYHARVRVPRASALLPKIIDQLFVQQWLTVSVVSRECGITPPAATGLIRKLEAVDIIREVTGARYGRTWFAPGVIDIIRREYDDVPPA